MKEREKRRQTVAMIERHFKYGDIISALEIAVVDGMTIEQFTVLYRQYLLKNDDFYKTNCPTEKGGASE